MDYLVFGEAILYLPHLHGLSKQAYLEKLHSLVALLPVACCGNSKGHQIIQRRVSPNIKLSREAASLNKAL